MDDSPALIVILLVGVLVVAAIVCSNVLPQVSENLVEYKEAAAVEESYKAIESVALIGQIQAVSGGVSNSITTIALIVVVFVLVLVLLGRGRGNNAYYVDQNHQLNNGRSDYSRYGSDEY